MKIVSWNLRRLSRGKLTRRLQPKLRAAGMGNDVGEMICRVVLGMEPWQEVNPGGPADVFVIIEVSSGGDHKGTAATGSGPIALASLVATFNAIANAGRAPNDPNPDHQWAVVPPLVVGWHETVGIIYNTRLLTPAGSGVLRDDVYDRFFLDRTPFWARFTDRNGEPSNVVGIHAETADGNDVGPGIRYANSLTRSDRLDVVDEMEVEDTYVAGDYNCQPEDTYGYPPRPFDMEGYQTSLPHNSWSTVRKKPDSSYRPPRNYLCNPYDNLMFAIGGDGPLDDWASLLDLIGRAPAPLPTKNLQMLTQRYFSEVSDHLPIVFNV